MYVLGAKIEIGLNSFTRVNEVEIEKSTKTLGATAIIKVPTTARLERQGEYISEVETAKTFKPGQAVRILLGYNGTLREEFAGYVRKVKPTTPLEIECEDAIYLLRRRNLKASFRSTTLKSLLEYILHGTFIKLSANVPGITLAPFYLKNVTAASALETLKEKYGLTMYFRSLSELFVGLAYDQDGTEIKYVFGQNVIDHDLEWVDETDTRIKIKAVHIRADNTRVEKEYGDSDGEERTFFFYNLPDGASLEQKAKEEALKHKYTGYKGGLNTFLLPNAAPGAVARVIDEQFAERAGDYLIDKVVTTYGTDGARRKIELGLKVS